MSFTHILRNSIEQTECRVKGHEITLEDEKRLYATTSKELFVDCNRCHIPLLLKAVDDESYTVRERYSLANSS